MNEFIKVTDYRRRMYKCGWYCCKCGHYNEIKITSILPAFVTKETCRQWDSNVQCERCTNVARLYRTERHVVQIRQIMEPINEITTEEKANDDI